MAYQNPVHAVASNITDTAAKEAAKLAEALVTIDYGDPDAEIFGLEFRDAALTMYHDIQDYLASQGSYLLNKCDFNAFLDFCGSCHDLDSTSVCNNGIFEEPDEEESYVCNVVGQ